MTSDEVRKLAKERYGTVRRFAKKIGYTESMLSHVLHGRRKIGTNNATIFATALGVDISEVKEYIET